MFGVTASVDDVAVVRAVRVDAGVCASVRLEESGEVVLSSSLTRIVSPRFPVELVVSLVLLAAALVLEVLVVVLDDEVELRIEEVAAVVGNDEADDDTDDKLGELEDVEEEEEDRFDCGEASNENETSPSASVATC